ncbi:NAD-dependent succinate-semialdehyde dehydrogenase [Saccharomonospora sp. NPDC046836]|uniref:NAD-dependent succinate-semialdehyde dehydrogenase n=1 Tax=Saccharomonospora sp. NPDC046836 TaxID=3156921 RepID=UPI0033CA8AF3
MTTLGIANDSRTLDRVPRPTPSRLHVDGAWVDAADSRSFEVENPATGTVLARVADATVPDATTALVAAAKAQAAWRAVVPRARAALLRRGRDLLEERAEDVATVMTLESGKPLSESRAEVAGSIESVDFAIERISDLHGHVGPGSHGGYDIVTRYEPIGPSLLITPWNFPLLMPARKLAAALAAGCTVVLKPAAETPLTALLLVEAFADAGLPPGVLNVLPTTHDQAISASVMADPRLRKISFTGSTAVGAQLLTQAAPHVISASMELGGDGPFLVLERADVEHAARQAVLCKFRNAGQVCTTANRILVHEAVADRFFDRFVALTEQLVVGDGFAPGTDVGPMISARQRERSLGMIREARESGATVLTGGDVVAGEGHFLQPTIITDIRPGTALAEEEIFAPVAAIYRVDSTDAAVALANDSARGLAGYVFSEDVREALEVADRLECGMVGVNRSLINDSAAPFGGVKSSGLGREGGPGALYEYLEAKYVALTR